MATNIPHLEEVTRLSPRVIRILGGNPSKYTLQGTNTYLIGRGPKRVLIDSGAGERSWPAAVQRTLDAENATISKCLLTHWHPDHVKGVPSLLEIQPSAEIFKNQPGVFGDDSWTDYDDGQRFVIDEAKDEVNGTTLRALYCPGHAIDHMSFVLEEEGTMFTGDNLLGHGTAVFEDLGQYMQSLATMRSAEHFTGRAYPGHGDVVEDGRAKLTEYMEHRREREKQIVEVMKSDNGKAWSSMDIVEIVYKDVRKELHEPAERGVRLVLNKLEQDGVVKSNDEGTEWTVQRHANL